MFRVLFGAVAALLMAAFYWMFGKWLSFYHVPVTLWWVRLLRAGLSAGVFAVWGLWNAAGLIALHLTAFFAGTELAAVLVRWLCRAWQDQGWYLLLSRLYHTGLIPVVLTAFLLLWGSFNMRHIVQTEYTVFSDKLAEDRDLVLLTDVHYDTIQDPALLQSKLQQINALQPDLVVLGGDIVEDGTSRQAMEQVFRQLGGLESRYGTFYIYGNHDRQLYADRRNGRQYTEQQLEQAILDSGIVILRDSRVELGSDLLLAGREDRSYPAGRIPADRLLDGADLSRFTIVADHQPVEVEQNAALGVDLQVSGHTHAGQIWPAGLLTERIFGYSYGQYWKDNCCVIVSSGTAGWGFSFRTEQRCEYVVIHLRRKQ